MIENKENTEAEIPKTPTDPILEVQDPSLTEPTEKTIETEKTKITEQRELLPNIIINIPEENNNESKKANRISIVGTVINLFLFLITLGALWQTKRSVDISEQSLLAAKENDTKDSLHQVKTDSINHIKDSVIKLLSDNTLTLQKQSVESQIKSLIESGKEFEYENRPFIQLGDFTPPIFGKEPDGHYVTIPYRIVNFGKLPANIVKVKFNNRIMPRSITDKGVVDSVNSFKIYNIISPNVTIGNVLAGGYPLIGKLGPLWDATFEKLKSGETLYYIFGEITYSNPITGSNYISKFIYRVNLFGSDIDIIRNYDRQMQ